MNNLFLIKDLAHVSGQSIHTIKYYLKIKLFNEIGRSPETRFRYFDQSSLKKLLRIRRLRKQNKSIREIQELLNHDRQV
ncbi:MAG: MerR family transcriptional regulator [Candidatus Omnitrophica bacterium]|nr:MerR family transcriptional regulator [Candidatus Omnitrophota bacterium]